MVKNFSAKKDSWMFLAVRKEEMMGLRGILGSVTAPLESKGVPGMNST
jgi:hypothetical protein